MVAVNPHAIPSEGEGSLSAHSPVSPDRLEGRRAGYQGVCTGHPSPVQTMRPWIDGEIVPAFAIASATT
jgi:hypothetical protein